MLKMDNTEEQGVLGTVEEHQGGALQQQQQNVAQSNLLRVK